MKKHEIEAMIEVLKRTINESDEMWNGREVSHAEIVGYLQGTIKGVITHLEAKTQHENNN